MTRGNQCSVNLENFSSKFKALYFVDVFTGGNYMQVFVLFIFIIQFYIRLAAVAAKIREAKVVYYVGC